MTRILNEDFRRNLLRLMWVGVLAAWTVYGVYIYNFGPGQWFKLSSSPADWGVFGDYVGGLLNPFLSFLTFIGIIVTVMLQARQLDIVREQANYEEIQRVLTVLSARIDGLLSSAPVSPVQRFQFMAVTPKSLFNLISALGTMQLRKPAKAEDDWLRWAMTEKQMAELQQTLTDEVTTLGLELETLAWTLNRYSTEGGSAIVIDFYKYRYRAILIWLDLLGLLDKHGQIQSVFKPKESRQYLVSSP